MLKASSKILGHNKNNAMAISKSWNARPSQEIYIVGGFFQLRFSVCRKYQRELELLANEMSELSQQLG